MLKGAPVTKTPPQDKPIPTPRAESSEDTPTGHARWRVRARLRAAFYRAATKGVNHFFPSNGSGNNLSQG